MPLGMSVSRRPQQPSRLPSTPDSAFSPAIDQQAGDYDEIMQGYRNLVAGGAGNFDNLINSLNTQRERAGEFKDVNYEQSPEWTDAHSRLRGLSEDGGLNEADRGNLRARGTAPIRAVYGNMQQNMDRQRSLSGGGSANYNASSARMARESSESIAGATTNVEAQIAKMVQEGRLAATPALASMATSQNNLMNETRLRNSSNRNAHNANNTDLLGTLNSATNSRNNQPLEALRGMTSLYGTNPGLVETFGNQVNQRTQINNNAANQTMQNRNQALSSSLNGNPRMRRMG